MKKKKTPRGLNGGRKPLYDEPTTLITFRVPVSKVPEVKKHIGVLLKGWEIKKEEK